MKEHTIPRTPPQRIPGVTVPHDVRANAIVAASQIEAMLPTLYSRCDALAHAATAIQQHTATLRFVCRDVPAQLSHNRNRAVEGICRAILNDLMEAEERAAAAPDWHWQWNEVAAQINGICYSLMAQCASVRNGEVQLIQQVFTPGDAA